ncbi:hypothetical protein FKM82_016815 [Ascaphus truei]
MQKITHGYSSHCCPHERYNIAKDALLLLSERCLFLPTAVFCKENIASPGNVGRLLALCFDWPGCVCAPIDAVKYSLKHYGAMVYAARCQGNTGCDPTALQVATSSKSMCTVCCFLPHS